MTILDRPRTSLSKLLNAKPFRALMTSAETPPKVVEKVESPQPVDGGGAGGGRNEGGGGGGRNVAPSTRDAAHYVLCEELVTLWNRELTANGDIMNRITIDQALTLNPEVVRSSYEMLLRGMYGRDHLGREHYCYCSPSRGQMFASPYGYDSSRAVW